MKRKRQSPEPLGFSWIFLNLAQKFAFFFVDSKILAIFAPLC
jgi:hypothetical protein